MSKSVVVMGDSGSGKTASMMNLDPASSFILQVEAKDLPFRTSGYKAIPSSGPPETGNLAIADKFPKIMKLMKYISANRPEVKTLVIDDFQYILTNEFMGRINEKSFDKFNDIAHNTWSLSRETKLLRDDLTVVILTHSIKEEDSLGNVFTRVKTLGKLIDRIITFEGLFTTVLMSTTVKNDNNIIEHKFMTKTDGFNSVKSPIEMFDEVSDSKNFMPNDLSLVVSTIEEYYNN